MNGVKSKGPLNPSQGALVGEHWLVYVCMRVCVSARVRMHACMCVCEQAYMCMHVCTYTCVHILSQNTFFQYILILFYTSTHENFVCLNIQGRFQRVFRDFRKLIILQDFPFQDV